MKLSEAKEKYIFCKKIELGAGEFVKMRELTIGEMDKLKKLKEDEWIAELSRLFPSCLIDHSFFKDEEGGEKASGDEVYDELRKSGSLFVDILTMWLTSLPLSGRLKKEPN
jgi:hypothetical protein